jgi:hypothetical protein
MFYRFDRQTLGLPAHVDPVRLAAVEKTGGNGANPETQAKSMGRKRASRWRKLAETGGNPQDARYGEPMVPALDVTPVAGDV